MAAAAAPTQTVQNLCNLVAKSRLMSAEDVKDAYRLWQELLGGVEGDGDAFRKYLVSKKYLTEYQSQLLIRGHTEGFFLDQYRVLELVSKGRMAGVYKAAHTSGQIVAIKVLPPSKAKDPTVLSRFQREGKFLTKLDHPNIVRAFQIGESAGKHYFVMEYFDNESLDVVLARRKRLPTAEAARIVQQTLLGLQHVFENGMIHRDLKPANLALTPPPDEGPSETTMASSVKIFDLGLGRTTFDEGSADLETNLTTAGTLLGTPDYMAPEQARNAHSADIRADIYSMGCVLYHLLTGQTPFPDANALSQIVKHATEQPKPLSQMMSKVPDGLQQIIDFMMAKDPNQRYPTPERAAQALQPFLQQAPAASTAASAPLDAYMKYLQASGHVEVKKSAPPKSAAPPKPIVEPLKPMVEPLRPVVEPLKPVIEPMRPVVEPLGPDLGNIPVGRLESDSRKKKEPAPPKPRLAPQPPPAPPPPPPAMQLPKPEFAPLPPARPDVQPLPATEEYDVEIVGPEPPAQRRGGDQRGLLDLDRRDWIMAGIGGAVVGGALLIGFGVSRMMKNPPPAPAESPTENPPADPKKKDDTK